VPDAAALYVDVALLTMLVPAALVPCQYHVSPTGAEPFAVNVTPASAHCGELDVGAPGVAGVAFTVTTTLAAALQHPVAVFLERI
jgi:hypothetical protein